MRPRSLEEFVGQEHILAPGKLLRRAIEADRLPSVILSGPPGTGKTTLAHIMAEMTHAKFVRFSGVESNVAEMRRVLAAATNRIAHRDKKRSCSSMRFITSTRRSRTSSYLTSKRKSPAHRRDDLQPVLLRQQRAGLAFTGFPARTAERGTFGALDRSRAGRQRAWPWQITM